MRFSIALAAVAWFATGCATAPPSTDCYSALARRQDLQPLREKVALHVVGETSFTMLANTALASDGERPLIAGWVEGREACFSIDIQQVGAAARDYGDLYQASANIFRLAALDLYAGKITFGEFNKQRLQLNQETQRARATLDDRRASVGSPAWVAVLGTLGQSVGRVNQTSPPKFTDCYRVAGGGIQCVTRESSR